jgi:hypothetical protein
MGYNCYLAQLAMVTDRAVFTVGVFFFPTFKHPYKDLTLSCQNPFLFSSVSFGGSFLFKSGGPLGEYRNGRLEIAGGSGINSFKKSPRVLKCSCNAQSAALVCSGVF